MALLFLGLLTDRIGFGTVTEVKRLDCEICFISETRKNCVIPACLSIEICFRSETDLRGFISG